jgi:hypothetical protein
VVLTNAELGVHRSFTVNIPPGETVKKKLELAP